MIMGKGGQGEATREIKWKRLVTGGGGRWVGRLVGVWWRMSVSVRGPFIKSVGSRIYRGMPHVAMQTWSMTCAVRAERYTLCGCFPCEAFCTILDSFRISLNLNMDASVYTESSDLWTNKPVLPKDRIWPLVGGTCHFLPTSALLLSPFNSVCVCVSVLYCWCCVSS